MTDFISIEKVYGILEDAIAPEASVESFPLEQALGRVLAETLTSPGDIPPFNNSAMDGFAFNSAELDKGASVSLLVRGTSYAGTPWEGTLASGEAVRIMTGAATPEGADTVIPFERTETVEENGSTYVVFEAGRVRPAENVRLRGEELRAGDAVMEPGIVLTPAYLGLAATLGRAELLCRKLRVAVFSTGDELVEPGTAGTLPPGKNWNSNSSVITSLVRTWGAEAEDLGILPDDPEIIRKALSEAAARSDFLIASGGVGEGEHDYTSRVLAEMGSGITHYHVSMRPGKPFSFGRVGGEHICWFMALPGNPVAAAVSAQLFLRRALRLAAGSTEPLGLSEFPAVAAKDIRGRTGRTDLVRGRADFVDGEMRFTPAHSQSSGMLTTLAGMNAMAVLDVNTDRIVEGDAVRCLRLLS